MAIKTYSNGLKYLGLSTDEKPNRAEIGATLFIEDTKQEYIFSGESWILKNQKTYEWLNQVITSGSFFSANIQAAGFDLATALVVATGSTQISLRVTAPDGEEYAWDPLGTMNTASQRASCQANVSGIEMLKVVASNNSGELVTANIYVYLGRRGGGF